MIDIKEILYDIDLKLNKIGTNEHQNIELENKIIAVNDAQINLIKTKYTGNNPLKMGLESFQKRYNDLETIIEKNKPLKIKEVLDSKLNAWEANLEDLKPEYMFTIPGSEFILADKGSCKDSVLVVNLIKNGDVHTNIRNTNTKPSFEYQETIGTLGGHRYEIYTDGTFTPKSLHISYIRYPKKVDFPGYDHFDGSASVSENSELPYFLKEELVDIAVRNLAMSTENNSAVQASTLRLQNGE